MSLGPPCVNPGCDRPQVRERLCEVCRRAVKLGTVGAVRHVVATKTLAGAIDLIHEHADDPDTVRRLAAQARDKLREILGREPE